MAYDFKTHGPRLMAENVRPGDFAGFLTFDRDSMTETLFAIDPQSGIILQRTQAASAPEFDGSGWTTAAAVPPHAEWIGGYTAPKARKAANDDAQRIANGPGYY